VERAKLGAERSGDVVSCGIAAMERIESSSKEISSILGAIDEIAFQTNLLALNAGVEAASSRSLKAPAAPSVKTTKAKITLRRLDPSSPRERLFVICAGSQIVALTGFFFRELADVHRQQSSPVGRLVRTGVRVEPARESLSGR
jgi:hypothetical protein